MSDHKHHVSDQTYQNFAYEWSQSLFWAIKRYWFFPNIFSEQYPPFYPHWQPLYTARRNINYLLDFGKSSLWAITKVFWVIRGCSLFPKSIEHYFFLYLFSFLYQENNDRMFKKVTKTFLLWAVTTNDPSQHKIDMCFYKPYGVIMYQYV